MSDNERILRLENALATLAELSASQERRVTRLEEAFVTLIELTRNHNEGIDELRAAQAELSAAQAETEHKLAALVDAHIRTEDALARLTEKVNNMHQGGSRAISQPLKPAFCW